MSVASCASQSAMQSTELVTFTLVRGGPSSEDYKSFANSRSCLYEALLMSCFIYDDIAFHEGNVPQHIQFTLREQM